MSPAETFGRVPAPDFRERYVPERASCACGGDIERHRSESIAVVVRRHQRTRRHRDWWERVRGAWQ